MPQAKRSWASAPSAADDDSLSGLNRSQRAQVNENRVRQKRRRETSSESDETIGEDPPPPSQASRPALKHSSGLSHFVINKRFIESGSSYVKTRTFFAQYDGGYSVSNGTIDAARRWAKQEQDAMLPEPPPVPTGGRPRILDAISMAALRAATEREKLRNQLIRPTTFQCLQMIDFMYWKQHQRVTSQKFVRKPSSRRPGRLFDGKTYNAILDEIWPETDKVDKKAQAREDAKAEPRNLISTAAVATAEFTDTNPDAIFSSDIFTLQRNARGQTVMVRMAAGSKKKMKNMGLTPGYKDDQAGEQFRVLPIMATIAMSGHLLCAIAIITDDQLPNGQCEIVALDSLTGRWDNAIYFVAYCGLNVPEELLYWKMFAEVVFPKSIKRVAECKDMIARGVQRPPEAVFSISPDDASRMNEAFTSPSTTPSRGRRGAQAQSGAANAAVSVNSGPPGAAAAPAVEMPAPPASFPRPLPPRQLPASLSTEWDIIHAFDGDCPQVKACFNKEAMRKHGKATLRSIAMKLFIRLIKWAAGTSMLTSPNDKGASHYLAKNAFKESVFETSHVTDANVPNCMLNHKVYFDCLPMLPASKKTYWTLLINLPWIFNRAFTIATVQSGWEKCGYFPTVDAAAIMEQWSGWCDGTLNEQQSAAVMATIDSPQGIAVVEARRTGRLADDFVDSNLPFLAPVFSIAHALEEMGFHRERTICFSKPGYFEAREQALQSALRSNPNMARTGAGRDRAPPRPPAEVVWFCDPANVRHSPTAAAIQEQLQLRRIVFRANAKKDKLLELWEAYDKNPPAEFLLAHASKPGAPRVAGSGRAAALSPLRSPRAGGDGGGAAPALPRERSRSRQ
jgi:hypothetical protein